MARADIKDYETGNWACWSTIVDDYVIDWCPEDQYKAELIVDAIHRIMQLTDEDYNNIDYLKNLVTYQQNGAECIITVKDINKVRLEESHWYTKSDCDAKKALLEKCDKCNHKNCDDCYDGDYYQPRDRKK